MTRESPPADRTDPEEIICRLCNRALRTITWTHLVKTHGWNQEGAVDEYKKRFCIDSSKCPDLRAVVRRNVRRYYERVGRRWTKSRIRREIRERGRRGLGLNHDMVAREAKSLENAALRAFGSWDAALEASGVSVGETRLQRTWSVESLREAILRIKAEGGELNAKAVEKRDPGLHQSARRFFGSWDIALVACGIDPLSVRKLRVRTPEDVLVEIRANPPMKSGEAFLAHRNLWVAARKHFGSWKAAALAAAAPLR